MIRAGRPLAGSDSVSPFRQICNLPMFRRIYYPPIITGTDYLAAPPENFATKGSVKRIR